MKETQVYSWNKRLAATYALGIWTMVGGYAIYRYTHKGTEEPVSTPPVSDEALLETSLAEEKPQKKRGFHVHHTVVYKENFVPFSTRIYNFVWGVFGSTSKTPAGTDRPED